uniref:Serine--tRNA ligase n=1 Tax=Panagrolaimus sp. JU765 TaxID=591449 RepID=A0AC34R7X4_9BILA
MIMNFKNIKRLINLAYSPKFLLATNTATMCTIYGIADGIVQMIEKDAFSKNVDFSRIFRVSSIGIIHGPMNHYWYKFLDKTIISGSSSILVGKKVFADLSISPFFTSTFIAGISFLEGKSMIESLSEYRNKFFQVLSLDFCVWPIAQTFNFLFLPTSFRVLFIKHSKNIDNLQTDL